ncbi:thioesterase family protein [Crossiella sp. SN42]|uniref:acyl-CoA thioesterase n=1 Tax=Crossiella sp. SN42 TaxID=2944808 RepID=UPI00207C2849|nr:thioesterase family protein [Crossiella sp. SN42]MCO1580449.1 thioesterase family protein [Crossiella sp. SN42]
MIGSGAAATSSTTTRTIDRSWWTWSGAHGGYTAALALAAMRGQVDGAQRVRTLSASFLAPVDERPLSLAVTLEHAGRSMSHAALRAHQDRGLALLATATFGLGRGPHSHAWTAMPAVPGVASCEPVQSAPADRVPMSVHIEYRPAGPALALAGGEQAELLFWVRFTDRRAVDAEAVLTLADSLPPSLFAVLTSAVPVPTVGMSAHFTEALDQGPAGEWVLLRATTEHVGSGWVMENITGWAEDGRLLCNVRQARRILAGLS